MANGDNKATSGATKKAPSSTTMFATYLVTGINQGCMFIYLGIMPVRICMVSYSDSYTHLS